jgi:alanine racemase
MELRRAGTTVPILCLGAVEPHQVAAAARSRVTLTLGSPEQLQIFETAGRSAGIPVSFHLKVDTGMNRLGLLLEDLGRFLEELRSCRSAVLSGLFSNLACADMPGEAANVRQGERLVEAAAAVRAAGHDPRPVHLANSAGLLYHPALRFDAVRPGLLLYGVRPGKGDSGPGFLPALSLKTTILRVKSVPQGASVGYGATFTTPRPSRLATLAIGYDDGLMRSLSGKGEVLIAGKRAPIVGIISMDLSVIDVTDCGEVNVGDEAVVIGTQAGATIDASEMAGRAGTIPWEIFCGIGRRVPRMHLAGQDVVSIASVLPAVKDVEMGPDSARAPDKPKREHAPKTSDTNEAAAADAENPPAETA